MTNQFFNFLKFFLSLSLFFWLTACFSAPSSEPPSPQVSQGVLDLSAWDFTQNQAITLDGEWALYWAQLLTPADFSAPATLPAPTWHNIPPGTWRNLIVGDQVLPGAGYGTYRLTIQLPPTTPPLALSLPVIFSSHMLWQDGQIISSQGQPSSKSATNKALTYPEIIPLTITGPTITLTLQIANFDHREGGLWRSLALGSTQGLHKQKNRRLLIDMFLFGSIFIMGFYHFGLYVWRRTEPSALYFGWFCILFSIRIMTAGDRYLWILWPDFNWYLGFKLEYFSTYLTMPVFVLFLSALFPSIVSRRFLQFIQLVGFGLAIIVLATPPLLYTQTVGVFQFFVLLVGAYQIYVIFKARYKGFEDANLMLWGGLVLFISLINDVLNVNHVLNTGLWTPLGLFIFILLQSLILARRFSKAFSSQETLLALQQELVIARRIQESILPEQMPNLPKLNILVHYRPAADVGGDFYDFHQVDGQRLGVLVADVSGHGIPAALIASMAKVAFAVHKDKKYKAEAVLDGMNQTLVGQFQRQFLSAVYIYLDLTEMVLFQANAGHHPVLVWRASTKTLYELESTGPVLGWLTDISYNDETFSLHPGDRILLYTDGIIEVRDPVGELFGTARWHRFVTQNGHLPPTEFTDLFWQTLAQWSADEADFEDDVTLMVLDVG